MATKTTSPIRIGVVGFSRNQFDQVTARTIIRTNFEQLHKKYGAIREVEIVSGYTAMGVPKIAYEEAAKFGFVKVGFSARQAFQVKCGVFQVDKEIIVGQRFGDESHDFVTYIHGLLRVGGGKQSRHEVDLFKQVKAGLPLEKILQEFEVDWYGG